MAKTKPARRAAATFTDEERAAMRDYVKERRSAAQGDEGDQTREVLEKIAAMSGADRELGGRLHAAIVAAAPNLSPRLWYGMPAYAKDGKVVCFFQPAQKFKTRYATLAFSDKAALDDGQMWPVAFAVKALTTADEAKIRALVKKAVR